MSAGASTRAWLFWAGTAVGAGVLAFGAGASGLLGGPIEPTEFTSSVVAPVHGTALLDCPAGEPIGTVPRNERVYVIGRSPDAQWLAVRSVQQGYRTVWLPTASLGVDEFPIRVPDLPVQPCVVPEVVVPEVLP
jgi:hypothetical protein